MSGYLRERAVVIALFAGLAALTFGLQSWHVGFWTPAHGWTSVHGLALMTHATPENGFVAYSMAERQPDGSLAYDYFDRYPVGFAALGRLLLLITEDLPVEVMIVRHWMNVIYLAVLFMAYRLARLTINSRPLAFAAAALAGSSYHMLYYKDMIHYDTPAVFGLLLMAYLIGRYKAERTPLWGIALGVLLTMSYGRSYPIAFMLAAWALVEAVGALSRRGVALRQRVRGALINPAAGLVLLAGVWSVGWLAYNTTMEARTRGVPIVQTSIVDSALRQLPFVNPAYYEEQASDGETDQENSPLAWGQFIVTQTERIALWAVPLGAAGDMRWRYLPTQMAFEMNAARLLVAVAVFIAAGWSITQTTAPHRLTYGLAAAGGLLWLYIMFSLSTAHIYVTMYALGLVLVAYIGLLRPLDGFRWAGIAVAGVALAAYGGTAWQVRVTQTDEMQEAAAYTHDLSRVRAAISEDWATVYFSSDFGRGTCIIRQDLCFAPGYYLGNRRAVATDSDTPAGYALSPHPFYTSARFVGADDALSLYLPTHPENERVWLFELNMPLARTAPPTTAAVTRFGDTLALRDWSISGDLTVAPCSSVNIESWWTAIERPASNYIVQISAIDEAGGAVAQVGGPPGSLPTEIWELDRFTLDVRRLVVPCDAPPGDYPLILGVYDPVLEQPLTVTLPNGTDAGNQTYLTNIRVP